MPVVDILSLERVRVRLCSAGATKSYPRLGGAGVRLVGWLEVEEELDKLKISTIRGQNLSVR